jgi:hypothetical protein
LHSKFNLVIGSGYMKFSAATLGRYPRIALLLLLLAAQGIANAHELGDSHAFASDSCASCIIGHGMGSAITGCQDAPQIQICHALIANHVIVSAAVVRTRSSFARAPPASL